MERKYTLKLHVFENDIPHKEEKTTFNFVFDDTNVSWHPHYGLFDFVHRNGNTALLYLLKALHDKETDPVEKEYQAAVIKLLEEKRFESD